MDENPSPPPADAPPTATCSRCSRVLTPEDRVEAGEHVFCRTCYETLREEVRRAVDAMTTDVPYAGAAVGALLGGLLGALAWWAFTAITHIGLGLLAVAIGFLAGHGTLRFAGGKRAPGLQALAIGASVLSFVLGTYLVNWTFINQSFEKAGDPGRLPLVPPTLEVFGRVVVAGAGIMDAVFLGICVYEAWSITRPPHLPGLAAPRA
jgi:hypothetical protein